MRLTLYFGWHIVLLLAATAPLRAQVPLDLADKKDFRALRLSSTDPKFKNADFRHIAPGQTLELGKFDGHGRITHIWFTIAAASPDHLRELVFRIYWDGTEKPAVASPLGDFFGLGFGKYVEYKQRSRGHRRYQGAQLLLADAVRQGGAAHDHQRRETAHQQLLLQHRLPPGRPAGSGHPLFPHAIPASLPRAQGKRLSHSGHEGSGHFVGSFLSVMANSDGWWGEGNDKFYVDGATKPTIEGTGSEDYFCGAWDFQHAFWNPYNGVPYYDNAEKGGEKRRHPQHLLPLAHSRPGAVHEVLAVDDRARPQRPRRRSQAAAEPLLERGILLPESTRGRWPGVAVLSGTRAASVAASVAAPPWQTQRRSSTLQGEASGGR